jgi:uncharacterized protein YjbI with pentapeptide repeats
MCACIVVGLTTVTLATEGVAGARTSSFLPGAPTNLAAISGNGQLVISWQAPASDGGSPITGYIVGGTLGVAALDCHPLATTCTVWPLKNGKTYQFRVRAVNALGRGRYSHTVDAVVGLPGAPPVVTATPGNASAAVAWTSASDGGSVVTSYRVTADPGGQRCVTSSNSCVVTGLANGTSTTFLVVAVNRYGTGPAGTASTTPATVPAAPTGVTGAPGDTSAVVTWTAPTNDGGSPVTGYLVTASPGGATCASTTTSCAVSGLANGDPYTFTVTATNSAGPGAPSVASAPAVPATVPGAPTDLTFAPGYESATVSWTPPADDGGGAITGYQVTESPGGGTCTATTTSCNVPGLADGTDYSFTVTASNWAGTGSPSAATPFASSCLPAPYTNVAGCELSGIDLSGDSVLYGNFTGADLTGADVDGADLSFAILTGADLSGAELSGANLNGITSGGITGTPAALPTGWALDNGYLIGPGSTITGADLGGTDLTSTDLNYDTLTGDSFAGDDLAGVLFNYATLTNDDFTGANLSGANLSFANLIGVDFTDTDLSGAIFNDTTCPDGTNSNNDGGTCIGDLPALSSSSSLVMAAAQAGTVPTGKPHTGSGSRSTRTRALTHRRVR